MLWKARDLMKVTPRATDGEIGSIHDIYFGDDRWTVRYLVVDTDARWGEARVLISPLAAGALNASSGTLDLELTRDRVRSAPGAETTATVSRHFEQTYHDYYGWPYYWVGGPTWGPFLTPGELARATFMRAASETDLSATPAPAPHPHLRSVREVQGYEFAGTDGSLGHVEDFLIDGETWAIVYVEIDTRSWWPGGKKTLLAREWIDDVSWPKRKLSADIRRDAVRDAPAYDENKLVTRAYEKSLLIHYGREVAHSPS